MNTRYAMVSLAALMMLSACATPPAEVSSTPEQPAASPVAPTSNAVQPSHDTATDLPPVKAATMSVEGEPTEVEMKLFAPDNMPITTYVPEDFTTEMSAGDEGRGATFYFSPTGTKDENAFVRIVIPETASVAEVQDALVGTNGLLARNQWTIVERTQETMYPWMTERITYREEGSPEMVTGSVFVGAHEGQAFYIYSHFPAEYGDGFAPRANLIMENIDVAPES